MKNKTLKLNTWDEYVHYAVKGLLEEPVSKSSIGRFTDELKHLLQEFKVNDSIFLRKNISDIKPLIYDWQENKFQKRAAKDENTRLLRRRVLANYLNYLRVKSGWLPLRYIQTEELDRYFIAPATKPKPEVKPSASKNSLIEFERMALNGTFGKALTKSSLADYLHYLNRALKSYNIKTSEFCKWDIEKLQYFRENLKLYPSPTYKPRKDDLRNSKAALNKFIEYRTYKNSLEGSKSRTDTATKDIRLSLNLTEKQLIDLTNHLKSNNISYQLK